MSLAGNPGGAFLCSTNQPTNQPTERDNTMNNMLHNSTYSNSTATRIAANFPPIDTMIKIIEMAGSHFDVGSLLNCYLDFRVRSDFFARLYHKRNSTQIAELKAELDAGEISERAYKALALNVYKAFLGDLGEETSDNFHVEPGQAIKLYIMAVLDEANKAEGDETDDADEDAENALEQVEPEDGYNLSALYQEYEGKYQNRYTQDFAILAHCSKDMAELLNLQNAYMSIEEAFDDYSEVYDRFFDEQIAATVSEETADAAAASLLYREVASDFGITYAQANLVCRMVSIAVALEREKEFERAMLDEQEEAIEAAEFDCQGYCSGCKSFNVCAPLIDAMANEKFTFAESNRLCKAETPAGARYRHHLLEKEAKAVNLLKSLQAGFKRPLI